MGFVAMTATYVKEVASCADVDLIANSRRRDERAKGRTNSVSDFVLGNADVTGKTFMTVSEKTHRHIREEKSERARFSVFRQLHRRPKMRLLQP